MTLTICHKSAAIGLVAGLLATAAAWYGTTLTASAEITQTMLAQARCDPAGFVSITFTDGSQFTCVPAKELPPANREEAEKRTRGRKG